MNNNDILKDIMDKYNMDIEDVLNVRAMFGGTITVCSEEDLVQVKEFSKTIQESDEHKSFLEEMDKKNGDGVIKTQKRCSVHFKSIDDPKYNKAMHLYLVMSDQELNDIL